MRERERRMVVRLLLLSATSTAGLFAKPQDPRLGQLTLSLSLPELAIRKVGFAGGECVKSWKVSFAARRLAPTN